MAVNFPNSPTNGQTVVVDGVTYSWNAAGSVWDLVTTATSTVAVNAPLTNTGTSTAAVLGIQSSPVFSSSVGVGVSPTLNSLGNTIHVGADGVGAAAIAHFTRSTTGHTATDGLIVGAWSSGENLIYTYEAEPITISTSGAERMRVTAGGQVSIGRTVPPAYQTFNVSAADNTVVSVEDIGGGMAYLAQAGSVTLLGAEGEFRIRNGVNYSLGPISSGTDRMTINTSGHMILPSQPTINGSCTNTAGAGGFANSFSALTNIGFTIGADRITVPTAGNYLITFNTISNLSTGRVDAQIVVNGANPVSILTEDNGTGYHGRSISIVRTLAANDFIQFANTNWYVNTATGYQEWRTFSITKLS